MNMSAIVLQIAVAVGVMQPAGGVLVRVETALGNIEIAWTRPTHR
jgi:hypothetical protein